MQPSTKFDWGRVVTPLRWIARVVGVLWAAFLGALLLLFLVRGAELNVGVQWVAAGVAIVGLVAAIVWMGVGEIVGGLALIGAGLWFAANGGFEFGAFTFAAPILLPGLLFIACGWYTLAHGRHRTPAAMA